MEVANAIQTTWHPVLLWCVDPECTLHRRGNPHIHCRECGAIWPAWIRYREIDLESVRRVRSPDAEGLCERCYFEWKRKLTSGEEPA